MTDPILLLAQQAPHMTDAELRTLLALIAISNGREQFSATYQNIMDAGRISREAVARGVKAETLGAFLVRDGHQSAWRAVYLVDQIVYEIDRDGYPQPVDKSETVYPVDQIVYEADQIVYPVDRDGYPQAVDKSGIVYPVDQIVYQVDCGIEEGREGDSLPSRLNSLPGRPNSLPNRLNSLPGRLEERSTSHGRARVSSSSSSFNTSSKEEKEKREEETRTPAPVRAANGHGTASTGKAQAPAPSPVTGKPPRTTRPHSDKAKLDAFLAAHASSDDQRKAWRMLCVAGVGPQSEAMKEILANSPLEAIQEHVALREAAPERYPVKHLITALRYGPQALPDWATAQEAEPTLPKWQVKAEQEMAELGYLLEAR